MEIRNARELIDCRNRLFKQLRVSLRKLDSLNESYFTNTKEKRILKERIEEINYKLNQIEQIVHQSTNFKSYDFYEFLKKFLVLTEEDYEAYVLRIADSYSEETLFEKVIREKAWKKGIRLDDVPGKWCYIVSDKTTREFIEDNIYDDDQLEEFMDNINDGTIIIDTYYTRFFDKGPIMKKEYKKHPRLKTAIYELINLKIKHPELTDQERFNKVLDNNMRKNLDRGYDNEKKESK